MLTRYGKAVAALALLLVGAGFATGYMELVVIGAGWVVVGLAAIAWTLSRPRLRADRDVRPNRVVEGQPATAYLTVRNASRRRTPAMVALERFGDGLVPVTVPSLPSSGTHERIYRLPTERRGVFQVGPLTVSRSDPFHLLRTGQSEGSTETLWVHPITHAVSPFPNGRTRDLEGPTSGEAPQGGIAFHTLREYVVGDDLRLIHWRSAARTGRLMVRHNVDTFQPRSLVILETSEAVYGDSDGFDQAVRVAASLAMSSIRNRFPIRLRTTGGLTIASESGQRAEHLLDQLAALETSPEDDLSTVTSQTSTERGGFSLVVLTGPASARELSVIGPLRARFQSITIGRLGISGRGSVYELPGAVLINASSSVEFATAWNRRVGR